MDGDISVLSESSRIADAMPDYDVDREIGRGGMGIVYLGRHRRLDRGVAIKELPPSFAAEPEVRERFSSEARTLATLAHPHIVPIFDYVEREGLCLIVMEQLPGGTVWDRFTSTGLTPPTACAVVMACCAALQHAHNKGVLHLDVKPDNLMFDAESAVKVTDFGIARVISGGRTMGTVDGQVLGTPAYMSPEQARGEELTPASDVYAAGVMLYELLSGQLPWQGAESASELLAQRLNEDPISLRDPAPHVPQPIADVVMTALSRDADSRYQRAEDLGVAIGQACAESWGPGWLDHAGVAIVGSERLSRAARTTAHHAEAVSAAPAPTTAAVTSAPAGNGRANETVSRPGADVPGANATVITGRPGTAGPGAGAGATGVVGGPAVGPDRAHETGVVGTAGSAQSRARETSVAGTPAAPAGSHETVARDAAGADVASAPATGATDPAETDGGAPAPPSAPVTNGPGGADSGFEVVRAASAEPRIQGADLYQLQLADLIGVEDVLDPPKPPTLALALTGALFLAAALVALIGLGGPDRSGQLEEGQVELAGVDVASGDRISVDLSEDVTVRVLDRSLAADADGVELRFGYADAGVSTVRAPLRDGEALVDPGIAQRTVGGAATLTLALTDSDDVVVEQELGVDATQSWYLTVPFVVAVLLLLLAIANLESSLKPLRSGHTRFLSYIGAGISGAVLGVGVVLMSGALGFSEPTVPAAVVVAVLGGAAGVAAAHARIGAARRRRVRRAVQRAERTLGVQANAA